MYIRTSVLASVVHMILVFPYISFCRYSLDLRRGKLRGSESSKELPKSIFLFYGKAMVEIVNSMSNWVKNRSKRWKRT